MRIGVLSDTHIHAVGSTHSTCRSARPGPDPLAELERIIERHLNKVDRFIHLGDFTDPAVARMLAKRAPLHAVCGNCDGPTLVRMFPEQQVVDIGGFRIGLHHGSGSPSGLCDRVSTRFDASIDAVLFGHSHRALCEWRDGRLLLNPGSPTERRSALIHTVALLELGEQLEARIIDVDDDRLR